VKRVHSGILLNLRISSTSNFPCTSCSAVVVVIARGLIAWQWCSYVVRDCNVVLLGLNV